MAADQAVTRPACCGSVAAAAFLPVIFANLVTWLRSDEDPDEALHRLVATGGDGRIRAWAHRAGDGRASVG